MSDFDHKTLIASLPPDERAALVQKTDTHGLRHFAGHFGAIVLCGSLIAWGAPLWPVLMVVQGVLICFLFTALHETLHGTPFRTPALNTWVGRICGFLTFLEPEWFRYFHLAHHRYTHDPENDPELAGPKPETPSQYLIYLSGLPDIFKRLTTLVRNATRTNEDAYVPARGKAKVMAQARLQLALYAAIVAFSVLLWTPVVLFIWLLPFLIGAPFLRAYLLAEHTQCPNVASMLDNTRTTLTTRVVRWLAWNMPYHAEHHAYPAVPFHKLPAFHAHTAPHITHLQPGYLRFHRTYLRASQTGVGR